MNLFTGYMTREVTNPGRVIEWHTDHNSVVRVGVALEKDDQFKVIHRAGTNAAWQTIAQFRYDADGISPLGFDYDNRTLFVGHCGDRDTEGIYKFDVAAKQIKELCFCHAEVDASRVIFSNKERALVGVSYQHERPETFWFSQSYRRMQASVDRALPDTLNFLGRSRGDEAKAVILARSDRAPGTFYLLNQTTSEMEKLFDTAEWLDPEQMAEMEPIQYRARDGLMVHGYLILPKGSSGKHLPLIVNPHGGPEARDVWGFDPEVQFFANRGYAVLRMNFRGSTGYGKSFREAGYKQWGA
jgi:dipeptidyl aminopeptidase/acylaminoacyl peptidase